MLSKWRHYAWCISLVLCMATAVLWVRSYRWNTFVAYDSAVTAGVQWQYYVDTYEGTVHVARLMNADAASQLPGRKIRFVISRVSYPSTLRGVRYWVVAGNGFQYQHITLPFWMIAAACAILPAWGLVRWTRRARRRAVGLCRTCGYSLTGNASDVCPECGTAVKT